MAHNPMPHDFKVPQLSYDAEPNVQPYIRLSFFFQKLPHISYEQFYRHWATVHADLSIGSKSFAGARIGRYAQVSFLEDGLGMSAFDAFADSHVPFRVFWWYSTKVKCLTRI
jgi:hypothetical protein